MTISSTESERISIAIVFTAGLLVCQLHWLSLFPQESKIRTFETPGGVIYEILKKGSGEPAEAGDEVVVHEKMGYLDGTILYSSREVAPARFLLGVGQAIKGVDEGVRGMRTGEIRRLIIPPSLSKRKAYPSFLSPDSTLLYEIELLEIIPPPKFPPLSARGKIVQQVGFNTMTVDYERPSVRGRKIFGHLVPYDTLWKTGAGAGTRISFSEPVTIENNAIEAGTYSLLTIPGQKVWSVILTRDTTFFTERKVYDLNKEVARFQVLPIPSGRFFESFTINVDLIPHNAIISLSWENTQVRFKVNTSTDSEVTGYITESLLTRKSQNPDLYATAADYYYFGNRELESALLLIDEAIKKGPKPWYYRLKFDILERMNKNEEAIEVAQQAMEYIDQNHQKLGWDATSYQQSIEMYLVRIEQLKGTAE